MEEAAFFVGAAPRLYNEDLRQLRDRDESISGAGSYSRELGVSGISSWHNN
jgi:hypothetical protein